MNPMIFMILVFTEFSYNFECLLFEISIESNLQFCYEKISKIRAEQTKTKKNNPKEF